MKFGLTVCNHGAFADPVLLSDLAVDAEAAGWHGFFLWDHIARRGEPPMTDPWIAMAAIAARTTTITLGPMVTPLARRRPWKLAREAVALDRLSGGRLVLGVGLGLHEQEFGNLGEADTATGRAALLDEGLDVVTALWSGERVDHHGQAFDVDAWFRPGPLRDPGPGNTHGIPIWVGGTWPNRPPFRRAARFDGIFPAGPQPYAPQDYLAMTAFVHEHRLDEQLADHPVTLVHQGSGEPGDIDRWPEYQAVGVDWWLESFRAEERGVEAAQSLIEQGPPARD